MNKCPFCGSKHLEATNYLSESVCTECGCSFTKNRVFEQGSFDKLKNSIFEKLSNTFEDPKVTLVVKSILDENYSISESAYLAEKLENLAETLYLEYTSGMRDAYYFGNLIEAYETVARFNKTQVKLNENDIYGEDIAPVDYSLEESEGGYENVVFLQGDEAEEPLRIYDEQGEEALLDYLKGWHYPGEHEIVSEIGSGTSDDVIETDDGYTLVINQPMGYVGLYAEATDESVVREDDEGSDPSTFEVKLRRKDDKIIIDLYNPHIHEWDFGVLEVSDNKKDINELIGMIDDDQQEEDFGPEASFEITNALRAYLMGHGDLSLREDDGGSEDSLDLGGDEGADDADSELDLGDEGSDEEVSSASEPDVDAAVDALQTAIKALKGETDTTGGEEDSLDLGGDEGSDEGSEDSLDLGDEGGDEGSSDELDLGEEKDFEEGVMSDLDIIAQEVVEAIEDTGTPETPEAIEDMLINLYPEYSGKPETKLIIQAAMDKLGIEDEGGWVEESTQEDEVPVEDEEGNVVAFKKLGEAEDKVIGWIAFYNRQKYEIKKSETIRNIADAKQAAIKHFKVPKSKMGLLAVKPGYDESVNEEVKFKRVKSTELADKNKKFEKSWKYMSTKKSDKSDGEARSEAASLGEEEADIPYTQEPAKAMKTKTVAECNGFRKGDKVVYGGRTIAEVQSITKDKSGMPVMTLVSEGKRFDVDPYDNVIPYEKDVSHEREMETIKESKKLWEDFANVVDQQPEGCCAGPMSDTMNVGAAIDTTPIMPDYQKPQVSDKNAIYAFIKDQSLHNVDRNHALSVLLGQFVTTPVEELTQILDDAILSNTPENVENIDAQYGYTSAPLDGQDGFQTQDNLNTAWDTLSQQPGF